LTALWIIVFFSMSESKLPTYIVPAFPPICLLMGVLLERKVFNRSLPGALSACKAEPSHPMIGKKQKRTFLEGLTRRAPFELALGIGAAGVAVYVLDPIQFVSLLGIGLPVALLTALAVVAIRFRANQNLAWTSFGLIALMLVLMGAHHLVPAISKTRSVHLAAEKLGATPEFKDAPVVFFGRETYGAGLTLDSTKVFYFEETQNVALIKFLEHNPTAIIVSSDDPMETLRADLPWTIALEECAHDRHLYVSHPNRKVIARERAQHLYR
jgi:hypothetical protein